MTLGPIKTESDYEAALSRVAALFHAPAGTPEGDELDILLSLVDAYEASHHPIGLPHPIEAILFRLDQAGLTRKDLEPMLGTSGRVSELLNGERSLTLQMIRNLHRGLGIPLESLALDESNLIPPASEREDGV